MLPTLTAVHSHRDKSDFHPCKVSPSLWLSMVCVPCQLPAQLSKWSSFISPSMALNSLQHKTHKPTLYHSLASASVCVSISPQQPASSPWSKNQSVFNSLLEPLQESKTPTFSPSFLHKVSLVFLLCPSHSGPLPGSCLARLNLATIALSCGTRILLLLAASPFQVSAQLLPPQRETC